MAKKDNKQEQDNTNIVSGIILEKENVKIKGSAGKVFKSGELDLNPQKVQVVGGDSDDFEQDNPPAIVIEKEGDKISKIIVRCPCGRHAELVCEYKEEE